MCLCVHILACTCLCLHVNAGVSMCLCVLGCLGVQCTSMCVPVHVYMMVCTRVCAYLGVCVQEFVYWGVCACICTCVSASLCTFTADLEQTCWQPGPCLSSRPRLALPEDKMFWGSSFVTRRACCFY